MFHHISRLSISFGVGTALTSAHTPITIRRLNRFDPITLPREISAFPESPEVILTAASGQLVPMDTIVSPITTDGTLSIPATEDAPSTKKSAPLISSTKPAISNT